MPKDNLSPHPSKIVEDIRKNSEMDIQDSQLTIAQARYHQAQLIVDRCVREIKPGQRTITDRLDAVLCNRIAGPIFLLFTLFLVYELAIVQGYRLSGLLTPLMSQVQTGFLSFLPAEGFIQDPVITSFFSWVFQGVFSVLVYIPIFVILFLIIAVMEDSGYMARVAFILDRVFRPFGLHGQSALPLILSGLYIGGCAVPGVMATRTIKDKHARLATILIIPLMNCMAKIPFFTLMVGLFFPGSMGLMMFLISTITIFLGLSISSMLSKTILRKVERAPFIMELPPYHIPSVKNVMTRVIERTWGFIKKVVTIVAVVMAVLFFLLNYPALGTSEEMMIDSRVTEALNDFYQAAGLDNPYLLLIRTPDQIASYLSYVNRHRSSIQDRTLDFLSPVHQDFFRENPSFYLIANGGTIRLSSQNRDQLWISIQEANNIYQSLSPQDQASGLLKTMIEPSVFYLIGRSLVATHEGLMDPQALQVSQAIRQIQTQRRMIRYDRNEEILMGSFLGSVGKWVEPITKWAGFDWRINVGLISAFAAKENVVATLGVLYRDMDDGIDATPLHGAAMILFMILYPPCLATIVTIAAQIGWKWAVLATVYPIVIGFLIAGLVFSLGTLLGFTGVTMFLVVYAGIATLTIFAAISRKRLPKP